MSDEDGLSIKSHQLYPPHPIENEQSLMSNASSKIKKIEFQ